MNESLTPIRPFLVYDMHSTRLLFHNRGWLGDSDTHSPSLRPSPTPTRPRPHTHPQVMEARRYGLRRQASATEREPFSGVMAGMTCMLRQTAAGCPPVGICYCSRAAGDSVCTCECGHAQTYRKRTALHWGGGRVYENNAA